MNEIELARSVVSAAEQDYYAACEVVDNAEMWGDSEAMLEADDALEEALGYLAEVRNRLRLLEEK